jgi:chorismate-pyruvate lyase
MKLAVYNKEYRLVNQQRLNENKRKIYQLQKAKIYEQRQILIKCDCGLVVGCLSLVKCETYEKNC